MAGQSEHFIDAVDFTLAWEGAYSDDPADPGGSTNFGITQTAYDTYRRRQGLPFQSVQKITRHECLDIYLFDYWLAGDCNLMPSPLDTVHFDTCVNFGPFQAAKFLQKALGVTVDGSIGRNTFTAIRKRSPSNVAKAICDERIAFRLARVQSDPTQEKFLQGWLNRDKALKKTC